MRRFLIFACLAASAIAGALPAGAGAQAVPSLGGVWTLNRALSEWPPEIGFNVNFIPTPDAGGGQGSGSNSGGRGRRGGGGGGNRGSGGFFPRESSGDARAVQLLTGEARNPPVRLMIVETPATITITNEIGQSRAFHPDGREQSLDVENLPIRVMTRRDGDRLVVVYGLEAGRSVRYTYSRSASPSQLLVEVEFLGQGGGDKARRIYEPGVESQTAPPATSAPARESPGQPPAPESFDQRPGAELRGLKSLGILVEDLSAQATACGLNHDAIEAALSKRLTDAGLTVRRNSDEDTYVYVNVMTTMLSGSCVSRFDAFLYTHATANLSYRDRPVLVQVSLMHRGSIASGASASHAAAVGRGLEGFIDLFATQIRSANK